MVNFYLGVGLQVSVLLDSAVETVSLRPAQFRQCSTPYDYAGKWVNHLEANLICYIWFVEFWPIFVLIELDTCMV